MRVSVGPKTVVHPHPVFVVGSYGKEGKPNMMTASWGGISSSQPPCLSVSLRKATLTYHNIMAARAFTVNIPSTAYVKQADYVGIVSGRDVDKFEVTGLTAVKSEKVNAPYVEEFPVVLECKLLRDIDLGLHTQFIGEIMDLTAHEEVLGDAGLPDIEKVAPLVWGSFGSSAYYGIGEKLGDAFSIGNELK
jgi:flavin reductase (DIM6/NTAB) family NADH-FMN oxidoreductase RutF